MRTTCILAGRDRINEVLRPLLGAGLAMERANNIAQVLVFCAHDPEQVARGMLRALVDNDLDRVASEVGRAWERGLMMEQIA